MGTVIGKNIRFSLAHLLLGVIAATFSLQSQSGLPQQQRASQPISIVLNYLSEQEELQSFKIFKTFGFYLLNQESELFAFYIQKPNFNYTEQSVSNAIDVCHPIRAGPFAVAS